MKFVAKLIANMVDQLTPRFDHLSTEFLKQTLKIYKAMRIMEKQKIQSPFLSEFITEIIDLIETKTDLCQPSVHRVKSTDTHLTMMDQGLKIDDTSNTSHEIINVFTD